MVNGYAIEGHVQAREIHRLLIEEAPLVPLIYGQSTVVHARKVRNVTITATGVLSLAGAIVG